MTRHINRPDRQPYLKGVLRRSGIKFLTLASVGANLAVHGDRASAPIDAEFGMLGEVYRYRASDRVIRDDKILYVEPAALPAMCRRQKPPWDACFRAAILNVDVHLLAELIL
jgi:hypothetical protein